MYKKFFTILLTLFFIAIYQHVYAENSCIGLVVRDFKQFQGGWENNLMNNISGQPISKSGCLISSMANILHYHGFRWIPDDNHVENAEILTNPGSFNKWLMKDNVNGYDKGTVLMRPGAIKKFYYKNIPLYSWNKTILPNDYCSPFLNDYIFNYDLSCFKVDWSDPKAATFLDNDLNAGQPDILRINGYYETYKGKDPILQKYKGHFVTATAISGVYPDDPYHVNDPGRGYKEWLYGIPLAELYHKLLRDKNQTTQIEVFGKDRPAYKILELRRYVSGYERTMDFSFLGCTVHSPVEILIIDQKGRATGYDPVAKTMIKENPKSLYYEESLSQILIDSDDPPDEPIKSLWIDEPIAGNYILKIFGTGDGPYTIDLHGETKEGTANLDTSITGTAYLGLQETYRIKYSPTGEASLSHDNQPPIADAGSSQTGEQGYEIKLDGSASNDLDGDPLKYTWTLVSKPIGSQVALSDPSIAQPTFTPDIPGTYALQLAVNDYFTDSQPRTVTITALPIKSRIAVAPNLATPLHAGPGVIAFDVVNTGRAGVSSGRIDASLTDPAGAVAA